MLKLKKFRYRNASRKKLVAKKLTVVQEGLLKLAIMHAVIVSIFILWILQLASDYLINLFGRYLQR